jgi:Ca2+-binding RTX toxin-like protein
MRSRSASALVAGVVAAASLAGLPEARAALTCFGKPATIVGRRDQDVHGTNRADVIVAGAGSVNVYGRDGNDLICLRDGGYDEAYGGRGRDRIDTGRGLDPKIISGGPGADFLYDEPGGAHIARFFAGAGDDEVRAGDALDEPHEDHDWLIGGAGDDVLLHGQGSAHVEGGPGDDVTSGGPGIDTLMFSAAPDPVDVDLDSTVATGEGRDRVSGFEDLVGSDFDDVLAGTDGPNLIDAGHGNDRLLGEGGDDRLRGQRHDDELVGGEGNDELGGGRDDDVLDGGPDTDRVTFTYSHQPVTVDLAAGTATGDGEDALRAIEDAMGSNRQGDTLLGDDAANYLIAGGGDVLRGRGGDDLLEPMSLGEIDGGDGSDTVVYRTFSVTVNLTTGTDSTGTLLVAMENVLTQGARIDVTGDEGPNRLTGASQDDVLRGMGGDDVLFGRGGPDELDGGLGDDDIDGGRGSDTCTNGESVTSCEG